MNSHPTKLDGAADMNEHEIALTVNRLRDIAKEYGQTQQLRARIAAQQELGGDRG
jgi:hypothetical protein